MKRTTTGLRPNILISLHSSLILIAMLFLVSCGSDDKNNNNNPYTYPAAQCLNPTTNQYYTCNYGDVNYPINQNPGFTNQPQITFEQLKTQFQNMAMNKNTAAGNSILLNTSSYGIEVQVMKSVDANKGRIELIDGNGYDVIDAYDITKAEVLENIFGEQQSYTAQYYVYPVRVCVGQRMVNGYAIIERQVNYNGTELLGGFLNINFNTSSENFVIVSTEVPFFANPLSSNRGWNDSRTVQQINREYVNLNCGYQGGFQQGGYPYGW